MKSVFVPVGGGASDEIVFATAWALARPLAAHLRFFHVHVRAGNGAVYPHRVQFASGAGLRDALGRFDREAQERSEQSLQHVHDFCARAGIEFAEAAVPGRVSASWQEESASPAESLIRHARHNDCVVTARASGPNGLPRDFLEQLLTRTGRPALIAGDKAPEALDGTIMVAWREAPEAARAVAVAQPLLLQAKKTVVVHVAENNDGEGVAGAEELVQQLVRSGARAETRIVTPGGEKVQALLAREAAQMEAGLIVMGAFGHSRLREFLFGGCTQTFVEACDRPVLLMH